MGRGNRLENGWREIVCRFDSCPLRNADVAQLVEQCPCNAEVVGSIPTVGLIGFYEHSQAYGPSDC